MSNHNSETVLPLFPLPDYVMLPHVHTRLHIFEPRYRAMMKHILDRQGRFCVGTLVGDWRERYEEAPDFHPIGCLCSLGDYHRLPDGRYNLAVAGVSRVRLREVTSDEPFRLVAITELPYDEQPVAEENAARFRRLAKTALAEQVGDYPGFPYAAIDRLDLMAVMNMMAFSLSFTVEQKLAMIGIASPDALCEALIRFTSAGKRTDRSGPDGTR